MTRLAVNQTGKNSTLTHWTLFSSLLTKCSHVLPKTSSTSLVNHHTEPDHEHIYEEHHAVETSILHLTNKNSQQTTHIPTDQIPEINTKQTNKQIEKRNQSSTVPKKMHRTGTIHHIHRIYIPRAPWLSPINLNIKSSAVYIRLTKPASNFNLIHTIKDQMKMTAPIGQNTNHTPNSKQKSTRICSLIHTHTPSN